ncbi:MAG: hypothetical protein QM503_04305 [Bacteroidota bacterium]
MKKYPILVSFILILVFSSNSMAQVAINTTGAAADPSAMLDVVSTTKGVLIPRMIKTERDAISSPATGLMIYQTDNTPGYYYYNGSSWGLIGDGGATDINGLSDGKTGGNSVFLGTSAGANDDGTDNKNIAVGIDAFSTNTTGWGNVSSGYKSLFANTSGSSNVANGCSALIDNTTGSANIANGYLSLGDNTVGNGNIASGYAAMGYNTSGNYNISSGFQSVYKNISGDYNIGIGYKALYNNTIGNNNICIGYETNYSNQEGSNNTIIGYQAGYVTSWGFYNKSGNIFLGYQAGYSELGDNKLYIENTNTSSPLIYGEFDNNLLRINGTLDINNAYQFPTSDGSGNQVLRTDGGGSLSWSSTSINNLNDGKTGGNSVFIGANAGVSDDETDNQNVGIGIAALYANTTGYYNTALGYRALGSTTLGNHNTAIGKEAMYHNTQGGSNTAIGVGALYSNTIGFNNTANGLASLYYNTSGDYNTADGEYALYSNTVGDKNIGVGFSANSYNQEGSNNTIIGYEAGRGVENHNKSGNIFLGYQAGYSETGDNKLYIENSNSTTPLIYGNFDSDFITIHGNLGVGTKLFGNGTNTLSLINGNIPNASISNGILLYAEDVTTSELRVRDEAGNITTLSPHNFSVTTKSEPMAWSYYSENTELGKVINVDMLRAIRLIEKFTGEKLAFINNIKEDVTDVNPVEITIGIIQQQQMEIDELKKVNTELIERLDKLENIITKR